MPLADPYRQPAGPPPPPEPRQDEVGAIWRVGLVVGWAILLRSFIAGLVAHEAPWAEFAIGFLLLLVTAAALRAEKP
jgi:hypothetical protein